MKRFVLLCIYYYMYYTFIFIYTYINFRRKYITYENIEITF